MGGVYHQRVFRNVLPSPLATNAGLRIARTPCVRGPPACTPAHGSACVHVPCADMHAGEHACTNLVLACTPENMCARVLCWRARRRTCVHEPRAGVHAGEHACTSLVLTCTPENMRARGSCWHTRQGTCLDVARADLHRPRAGLHCRVPAARLVSR